MYNYKSVAKTPAISSDLASVSRQNSRLGERWLVGLALCVVAFTGCILLTMTPVIRMPDKLFRLQFQLRIGWGAWLGQASQWLPANLGSDYQPSSASIELFSLLTLAFLCYGLAALLVGRRIGERQFLTVRSCIWLGLILAGVIYVVTPGVLSHDMLVYAGYSRLVAVYHANPYFILFQQFPHDPLEHFDDWAYVNSLYGPIWILVCSALGFFVRPTAEAYIIAFRIFALAMQILNTWLVDRVLRARGYSQRMRTLGMLLYAWNPLVLLESSLNGHNDVFMLTFVLLGILLLVQAEKRGELLRARGYLPPLVVFTLAVLVKFAILPVLAVYLLFLACKALRPSADSSLVWKKQIENWQEVIPVLFWSGVTVLLLVLVCYGPFWAGHSGREIINSFAKNPASVRSENSLMRALVEWLKAHPEQSGNPVLVFFSWRRVWDIINYLAIVLCLVAGARFLWRTPTVRAALALMLALMALLLLLTPWFFAWYVSWIVVLAVVCLPARESRLAWSSVALALTYSYSAL